MQRIYLDYNASIAPEASDVMRAAIDDAFGNPSSLRWAGAPARHLVETARGQVVGLLGCSPQEVVFTSGGSEANNLALKGAFFASGRERRHFVTTSVEHPAIVAPLRFLERLGAEVTWLSVDGTGRVDPDSLRRAIRADTILVTVMHANNEVGTVLPIAECAAICRQHGIPFHTDAAQSVGKRYRRGSTISASTCSPLRDASRTAHSWSGARKRQTRGNRKRATRDSPGNRLSHRRGGFPAGSGQGAARQVLDSPAGPLRRSGEAQRPSGTPPTQYA